MKTNYYKFLLFIGLIALTSCKELAAPVSQNLGSSNDSALSGGTNTGGCLACAGSGGGGGTGGTGGTGGGSDFGGSGDGFEKVDVSQAGQMGNRNYILSVFKEIYASTTFPNNAVTIATNVLAKPGVFGLACETISSGGDVDCGGDVGAGTTGVILPQANSMRQLQVLKLCEDVLVDPKAVNAAAEKIGEINGTVLNEISAANIPKIFGLFYRQRDIASVEMNAFVQFNQSLKSAPANMTLVNRWKSLLVMICESPEWQTF